MPRAPTICRIPGCPTIASARGLCPTHATEAERARGTKQQRGYDAAHDALRRRWAPRVARGAVMCWRCGEHIGRGEAWDLGHDDDDRRITRGPEHPTCNRAAGGRAAWR